jgi:hypothetical protein
MVQVLLPISRAIIKSPTLKDVDQSRAGKARRWTIRRRARE